MKLTEAAKMGDKLFVRGWHPKAKGVVVKIFDYKGWPHYHLKRSNGVVEIVPRIRTSTREIVEVAG